MFINRTHHNDLQVVKYTPSKISPTKLTSNLQKTKMSNASTQTISMKPVRAVPDLHCICDECNPSDAASSVCISEDACCLSEDDCCHFKVEPLTTLNKSESSTALDKLCENIDDVAATVEFMEKIGLKWSDTNEEKDSKLAKFLFNQ